MNRRRMMNGARKPLIVFAEGDSVLRAGTLYDKDANSNAKIIDGTKIGNGSEKGIILVERDTEIFAGETSYKAGYIDIEGIDFSGYKTLHFECSVNVANYEENSPFFYVGYGTNHGAYHAYYEEFEYAPRDYKTISFDISNLEGEYIIKGTAYVNGTAYLRIKNIWLE